MKTGEPAEASSACGQLSAGGAADGALSAAVGGERGILAIDTSLGTSVAFGFGETIRWAVSDSARGHVEQIGTLIERVLQRHGDLTGAGASAGAVSHVAVGIGPGPFTGLRVGIAAAKAFALGRDIPLLPLQGHEAAALEVLEAGATSGRGRGSVRVLQDAKRRELFVSEYSGLDDSGLPVRAADPALMPRAEYIDRPGDIWPERIPAARLVQLAARRIEAGRGFEPEQALYLRSPDVYPAAAVKRVST